MPKKLIIAAVCARPFVQAAVKAGHEVIALDAFADEDTRQAATQVHRIAYAAGRFDADQFMRMLHDLDLQQIDGLAVDGLVYGSGFEAAPELLQQVAQCVPLIGNTPEVLCQLKQPRQFFSLLDALQIPHPPVSFAPPGNPSGWLLKQGGGSGGTHIKRAQYAENFSVETNRYYQRELAGEPLSLLFAADGKQARSIGFNRQWLAPSADMPYRYGGAASQALLSPDVQQQLLHAAQQITASIGLRGLNSLDGLICDERLQVLEVNPRLSATFDLHDVDGALFDLHLQACTGDISQWPRLPLQSKAQHIVYAPEDLLVPTVAWPAWATDLPPEGSLVAKENPVCSVTAEGDDAQQARTLALAREQVVLSLITSNINKSQKVNV